MGYLRQGLPQGDPISPALFARFTAWLLQDLAQEGHDTIRGVVLSYPAQIPIAVFADDLYLVTDTPKNLDRMTQELHGAASHLTTTTQRPNDPMAQH